MEFILLLEICSFQRKNENYLQEIRVKHTDTKKDHIMSLVYRQFIIISTLYMFNCAVIIMEAACTYSCQF